MQQKQQEDDLQLAELTVKKQYYQVLLDQARQAVGRAETVIALRDVQVSAAVDELEYLRKALADIHLDNAPLPANACPSGGEDLVLCRPAWDVLGARGNELGMPPAQRERLQVALAKSISHYLDSVTIGHVRYEIADLQIKNISYQQAVDDSQCALTAYDALISSPLTLLANYHATGITPSDVAQFLQVLAIGGIAVQK